MVYADQACLYRSHHASACSVQRISLDGTVLKISQADRPLDLVGHVVKMVFDEADPISYALTLTDPYTTTGQFDIGPWSGHARRVFVQAVDELGNLSDAVSVALNLGDVETDNVLFTISEVSKGWTGTVINGSIDGATLKANETLYLWPQDDNAPLWPQADSFPLWAFRWRSTDAICVAYQYPCRIRRRKNIGQSNRNDWQIVQG